MEVSPQLAALGHSFLPMTETPVGGSFVAVGHSGALVVSFGNRYPPQLRAGGRLPFFLKGVGEKLEFWNSGNVAFPWC